MLKEYIPWLMLAYLLGYVTSIVLSAIKAGIEKRRIGKVRADLVDGSYDARNYIKQKNYVWEPIQVEDTTLYLLQRGGSNG